MLLKYGEINATEELKIVAELLAVASVPGQRFNFNNQELEVAVCPNTSEESLAVFKQSVAKEGIASFNVWHHAIVDRKDSFIKINFRQNRFCFHFHSDKIMLPSLLQRAEIFGTLHLNNGSKHNINLWVSAPNFHAEDRRLSLAAITAAYRQRNMELNDQDRTDIERKLDERNEVEAKMAWEHDVRDMLKNIR